MGQDTLQKKFSEALTFNTSCTAIVINDEAGLYLKNEEAAQELLSWLIAYYPVLEGEQPAFKENVELVKTNMPVDYVQDLEPAKQKGPPGGRANSAICGQRRGYHMGCGPCPGHRYGANCPG
jgi:hypothetical protein